MKKHYGITNCDCGYFILAYFMYDSHKVAWCGTVKYGNALGVRTGRCH